MKTLPGPPSLPPHVSSCKSIGQLDGVAFPLQRGQWAGKSLSPTSLQPGVRSPYKELRELEGMRRNYADTFHAASRTSGTRKTTVN